MLTLSQIRRILDFESQYGERERACFGAPGRYSLCDSAAAVSYDGADKPLPIRAKKYKGKIVVVTRKS